MHIDPNELRGSHVYRLMTSLVIPRPIAWVGTRGRDGRDNLAPFSYFMAVSSAPPSLAISVARAAGDALKDTARNILETGVFTVSMVDRPRADAMVQTSLRWPSETSEFGPAGLTPVSGDRIDAPYPAEARASMECRLIHTHDLGSVHLLVGQVVRFHIDDALIVPGRDGNPQIDAAALDAVARLGGVQYAMGPDIVALPPPALRPESAG
jgi:flavin reductase (DIM6/NTAB) family NADH-FMN oxidoreductase RutF